MQTRFKTHTWLLGVLFALQFLGSTQTAIGQSFDETFDLWPVDLKIGGVVIAGGGGELPGEAIEYFVKAADKEDATTIAIRFDGSASWSETRLKKELESAGQLELISISADTKSLSSEVLQKIEAADAVWIGTDSAASPEQLPLVKKCIASAKLVIDRGGIVCVNGEASELLGKYNWTVVSKKGIGETISIRNSVNLIPDSLILTNYKDSNDRHDLLGLLGRRPRCVGIGIERGTAIVLNGRKIRVLGAGGSTFCLMANEHKPVRVQHVNRARSRRANPYATIVDLTAWRREAIERTVAPFPAKVPPQPFVENGTLIIVGGGGMPKGLMDQMVELAGGKEAKLVYVPCAESDEVNEQQRMVDVWKKMGVKSASFIHTKDRNKANDDEEFLAPLKDATGIWFGGGRQWNFSDSYYGTQAHKLMKEVLNRGGVIGGSSAGASIQAAYMCRANPVANFDIMAPGYERGLGFISGIAIDQHFSQRGRQKDMTQLVNTYPQLLGVGIDESTAIIVQKSQAKVVGENKVHFYNRREPVVPGTDDFLALETGAVYDLARRSVIEDDAEENASEADDREEK